MKRIKRVMVIMMCGIYLSGSNEMMVFANSNMLMPCYESGKTVSAVMVFSDNKASCSVTVIGESDTSKITGTIKLYDETSKKTVKTWSVNCEGAVYSTNKSADVTANHKYTLSFSGKVYDANGNAESISTSTTKKN